MQRWVALAYLVKAKSNEGRLSVRPAEGLPFLLEEGMEVAFVPPVLHRPRRARVMEVAKVGAEHFLVAFDAVTSRDDAEALEGCTCLVREEDVPEGPHDALFDVGEGFSLIDEAAGLVGSVVRMEPNPAHPLLGVVPCEGGALAEGELLVPLVDDFLLRIDEQKHTIEMRLPAGLLEMDAS